MPIDYTHIHTSRQIMDADAVKTPIDPSGGGAISATDGFTTVTNVTTLRTPGTVVETSPGVAAMGGTVVAQEADPGAIGPGNLWLQVVFGDPSGDGGYGRLWVRNSSDDGWNSGAPMAYGDETSQFIASPDDAAELKLANAGTASYLLGNTRLDLKVGSAGITINSAGLHIGLGTDKPLLFTGGTDPSAGGGVAAPLTSVYLRTGTAQVWHKTGAGDTAWTRLHSLEDTDLVAFQAAGDVSIASAVNSDLQLTASGTGVLNLVAGSGLQLNSAAFTRAAFVDPATGTVEDIATALIASGLMAAS